VLECGAGLAKGRFAILDCRGCVPKRWLPRNQLSARSEDSDTVFTDIDLTDLWSDYDEKT
jgi:hypothetical protein